jgi:hypothetical protein
MMRDWDGLVGLGDGKAVHKDDMVRTRVHIDWIDMSNAG